MHPPTSQRSLDATRGRRAALLLSVLVSLGLSRAALAEDLPIEGPQAFVVLTVTDERSLDEFDWVASAHLGVDGNALPGATATQVLAVLDSGGESHRVSYPDAVALGLQGSFLSGETIPIGDVVGSITLDVSMPVGFFVHGLQDLSAGGDLVPALTFGQGNFAGLVNSASNHTMGETISTIIGVPFFAYFATSVEHSQPVDANVGGQAVSTPAVTFYPSPTDRQIPVLDKRIPLEARPGGDPVVSYFSLFPPTPLLPSLLGALSGSLFFTADAVTLGESTSSASGQMLVDTGSRTTIISVAAATSLGLNLLAPDFELELSGVGSATLTAPGFYLDELSVPATVNETSAPTDETWTNVPVVVVDVGSPEGGTLFGILGTNLLGNRDYVFNGARSAGPEGGPYLDLTEPFAPPEILPALSPLGALALAALLAGAGVRRMRRPARGFSARSLPVGRTAGRS